MVTEATDTVTATRSRIRIQGAAKSFSGRTVVDVDDLTLGAHPVEGLIGPNGAGKTTLMRMIMHSTKLDRGTVTLVRPDGDDRGDVVLSELPTYAMAGLGVVKTNQVIMDFEKLTIWDSMLLSAAKPKQELPFRIFTEEPLFAEHEEEMRHYLDFFSLTAPAKQADSAGEKKLLDIVRCLLLKPSFLLLDEPTAGLPDDLTEKVMEAIRLLAASGTSVVVVEHDLNVIWNLSDQVHFMAEGSVILQGTPEEIRRHETVVEKYLGEGHV